MRQLIFLLLVFAGYTAARAQPFVVDTSYTDKHWPVYMKVYPNGKTTWISIGDSAGTRSYYANTFEQGSGQISRRHLTEMETTAGIVAFDGANKIVWLELTRNTDTLFIRWLACDENGQLVQDRQSSLAVQGLKTITSGRFYDARFLLILEQFNAPGDVRNISMLELDTLGNLLVNRTLPGLTTIFVNNPNFKVYEPVTWLSDSSWLIQTMHRDTLAGGGQQVWSQKVTAFDYSGNMRWSIDALPYGATTSWKDENQLYLWAWGLGLRSYTRIANGLQLNWGKSRSDLGLSLHQMSYPNVSTDGNGITLVGNDTSYHIGIMRLDFQGNVLWHRKHALWHAFPLPPQFPQTNYENWALQIHRNADGHYWLYGLQQETIHFINYDHIGLWYAYLDSNGCVNQQCTPLAVEGSVAKSSARLKVYPNPANDLIHVNFENSQSLKDAELRLSDMQGRIWSQTRVNDLEFEHVLPVHELEPGIYVLQLIQDGRLVAFEKVIVQR